MGVPDHILPLRFEKGGISYGALGIPELVAVYNGSVYPNRPVDNPSISIWFMITIWLYTKSDKRLLTEGWNGTDREIITDGDRYYLLRNHRSQRTMSYGDYNPPKRRRERAKRLQVLRTVSTRLILDVGIKEAIEAKIAEHYTQIATPASPV